MARLWPVAWIIALYTGTALTAGIDVSPENFLALLLFEARHVLMHALAFGILTWLVTRAANPEMALDGPAAAGTLIALAFALGLGQEALQGLFRNEVKTAASLFDLIVDVLGAVAAWLLVRTRARRPAIAPADQSI